MRATDPRIEARAPVWNALSELFLDTELQSEDHERIARVLAASPYSTTKLEEILRFEVTPVLKANLQSMVGEWNGFDETWMHEQMTPRIDTRRLFNFGVFWMVRAHWTDIVQRVAALRVRGNSGAIVDRKN